MAVMNSTVSCACKAFRSENASRSPGLLPAVLSAVLLAFLCYEPFRNTGQTKEVQEQPAGWPLLTGATLQPPATASALPQTPKAVV